MRSSFHLVVWCCALVVVACTNHKQPSMSYQGHGVGSVSPDVLARFAPRKPDNDGLKQRIESLLDVRPDPYDSVVAKYDGRTIFFSWNVTGTYQVWRQDEPGRFPVQLTTGSMTSTIKDTFRDGWIVMQRDRDGEENPGVYLMAGTGGQAVCVQHRDGIQTKYVGSSPDERYVYLATNDVVKDSYRILAYDRFKQSFVVMLDRPGLWSVADVAPTGDILVYRAISNTAREFFRMNPVTREITPVLGHNEAQDYEALFGKTAEELIVSTSKKDGNFKRLYLVRGAVWNQLSPNGSFEVDEFMLPENRSYVAYTMNEHGFIRLHRADLVTGKPLSDPRLPDGADIQLPRSASPDGSRLLLRVTWARRPASLLWYDWERGESQECIPQSMPEVSVASFAQVELIDIPVRDGTTIPAFVHRAPTCEKSDKPCPVIVSFHGGPEGQSLPGYDTECQLFVDSGYIVVEPNIRGSTGYGKAYLDADNGPKRLEIITDVEDVARFVRTHFTVQGLQPRVGVYGGSYGGYVTMYAMTRFAGAYDAGVSVVGISNLLSFLENTAPYRRGLRITEYGDPNKDREALIELSPITHVAKTTGPLLLIQGATDPRVPVGEAVALHEALKQKNVPTDLLVFPDEGHGMRKRSNREIMYWRVIRWFDQHLVNNAR